MNAENVKSQMRKGTLEYCILLLLKKEPAYTSDIIQKLQEAKLIVVEGTLYPLLTRLKNSELLSYQWIESTQGPPRKYYQLTPKGEEFLGELETSWQELNDTIKKTLTVNLGGTVFHIDEDAYQLLDKYLANLRIHFRKEEGSEEIMNDFEMRISELFNERVRLGYEVITIEHVEEVIKRMGKPEELFEGEEEKEYKEEARTQAFQEEEIPRGPKKLMRDPDNRVLGGVAGGIAAYMGWDVTAVRLAMIILLFIPYAPIIILYLILWLVMPLARTAADKLMMRGQSVTLENIGKTVTDGFEKVSNNVNDYMSSDKPRSFLQKLADLFVGVVGFILKFLAILIGIILLPPLLLVAFILVVVTFALIAGGTGFLYQLSPFGANLIAGAPISLAIMGCIGFILLIGIPIFALVYAICMQLFKAKPLPNTAKWTLLILWLVSVVLCVIYFYQTGINGWSTLPWYNFFNI